MKKNRKFGWELMGSYTGGMITGLFVGAVASITISAAVAVGKVCK